MTMKDEWLKRAASIENPLHRRVVSDLIVGMADNSEDNKPYDTVVVHFDSARLEDTPGARSAFAQEVIRQIEAITGTVPLEVTIHHDMLQKRIEVKCLPNPQ